MALNQDITNAFAEDQRRDQPEEAQIARLNLNRQPKIQTFSFLRISRCSLNSDRAVIKSL